MSSYQPSDDFDYKNTFAPFAQGDDLPLPDVLTHEDVLRIVTEENVSFGSRKGSFWTAPLTLWAFVWQVLSPDKSCRQVVASVLLSAALSVEADAELDTAAYCRARAKLPATMLRRLALHVGHGLEQVALADWQWHKRRVHLVDGSTSALPDTAENQKAFPQSNTQKKGLGYPVIRWVAMVGLATAAIQGFCYGPYAGKETGETALFRELLSNLHPGNIVLADRYYCSYFMVALLMGAGVDVVMRLHHRRRYDFRRGKSLGEQDHIVEWLKPARPEWMSAEEYAQMPDTIRMRECRRQIDQPGYRVNELVIATTLLDANEYPADDIVELYGKRWHVELDIRSLKTTLGMEALRCQSPFMLEKEIWAHVLGYNLVRKVTAQAAARWGVTPRSISFKGTRQVILGGWNQASQLQGEAGDVYLKAQKRMLRLLRKQKVGDRPGRCEPRAVKRRPKPHKLLMESRKEARAKLLGGKQDDSKRGKSKQANAKQANAKK